MHGKDNHQKNAELSADQNCNTIVDIRHDAAPPTPLYIPAPLNKPLDKVKEPPQRTTEPGADTMSRPKRKRGIPLYVWVSQEEYTTIQQRMEEAGTQNLSAYIRKMALNGYVLNVDLAPRPGTYFPTTALLK